MVHISIKVNINLEGTKANHSTLVSFVVQMILVYSGFLIESNCGYNLYNIVQKPHLNFKNKLWTYISVILLFTLLVSKSLPPSLHSFHFFSFCGYLLHFRRVLFTLIQFINFFLQERVRGACSMAMVASPGATIPGLSCI